MYQKNNRIPEINMDKKSVSIKLDEQLRIFSNCLEDIFKFFASAKTCLTANTEHEATKLFKTLTDIPEPKLPI